MIGKEVEESLLPVANAAGIRIVEFTVAPQVTPAEGGLPYHEWFIEFDNAPADLEQFALQVDAAMRQQNIYYDDLITGNILRTLKIRPLRRDAFRDYMKSVTNHQKCTTSLHQKCTTLQIKIRQCC